MKDKQLIIELLKAQIAAQVSTLEPGNTIEVGSAIKTLIEITQSLDNIEFIEKSSDRKLQEQVSHLDRAGSRWPVIL